MDSGYFVLKTASYEPLQRLSSLFAKDLIEIAFKWREKQPNFSYFFFSLTFDILLNDCPCWVFIHFFVYVKFIIRIHLRGSDRFSLYWCRLLTKERSLKSGLRLRSIMIYRRFKSLRSESLSIYYRLFRCYDLLHDSALEGLARTRGWSRKIRRTYTGAHE